MIRLLLVDDHLVFRKRLGAMLNAQPDLLVAGEASDVDDAVAKAREIQPDLVLLDIRLKSGSGLRAIEPIRRACPGTRVAMLTMYEDSDYMRYAEQHGASSYLLKHMDFEQLVGALRGLCREIGPV